MGELIVVIIIVVIGSVVGNDKTKDKPVKRISPLNVLPRIKEQLMQAIVTSEILGPPKAKQRK